MREKKNGSFLRKIMRAVMVMTALACVWTGAAVSSHAKQSSLDDFYDAYELVMQVSRNGKVLTNSLLGYQQGFSNYYLPVKGLADLLELKADLDLENETVSGWYLKPENSYTIDAKAGTYTVRGELVDLAPGDVIVKNYGSGFGDIYVKMDVLETIFPLDLDFNFSKLKLDIGTKTKLPVELRKDREKQHEKLLAKKNKGVPKGFKTVDNPYRMFSKPVLDVNTSTSWSGSDSQIDNTTSISGKNDLFGFSADYFTNFRYQGNEFISPKDLRLTLTRRTTDDDPMLFGLREIKLGDVGVRTPTLLVGTNSGRGISVSSRPVNRSGSFDEITVEGDATPGWDIELYRNSELLDFGTVPDTGYYRFDNVELLAGANKIKVMLYGPSGEVEERDEDYSIGAGVLKPGEVEYQGSIVDTSDGLISFSGDRLGHTQYQNNDSGIAYSASARVGVNRWLSLFGTMSNAVTYKGTKRYATAGADLSLGPVQSNVEAYKEIGGGQALDTRFATSLLGWRTTLKTQFMNDFESDRVGYGDDAKTFNGRLNVTNHYNTDVGRLGITGAADYEKRKDGRTMSNYQMTTTLSQRDRSVGNRVVASYSDHQLDRVDGLLNGSLHFNKKLTGRAYLDYDVKPSFDLSNIRTELSYRESDKLSGRMAYSRNLLTSKNAVSGSVSYDFDSFMASLGTSWHDDGGVDVTLRASTSLAPYGKDGDYIMRSHKLQNRNALNVRSYLDKNLNDVYDYGDEIVANADMKLDKRAMDPTDEDGFGSIIQSKYHEYADLTMEPESADNPFYAASHPGYHVLLRPGVAQTIDFPLVETGVIDGTAYFENGKPVPGLRLQLVGPTGDVVKETLSSFDGFYTFEFVKPGNYIIQAAPQLDVTMPVRLVTVSRDALFAYGVNVKLLDHGGLPPSQIAVDKTRARQNLGAVIGSLVRLQSTLRSAVN